MSRLLKHKCTIGVDPDSRLCDVSPGVFLTSFANVSTEAAIAGEFAAFFAELLQMAAL